MAIGLWSVPFQTRTVRSEDADARNRPSRDHAREKSPTGTYQPEYIALPHCHGVDCNGMHLAIGRSENSIDWEIALGFKSPVKIVVLALTNRRGETLAPVLTKISDILSNISVREEIRFALTTPLSHAALVKRYLDDDWPV